MLFGKVKLRTDLTDEDLIELDQFIGKYKYLVGNEFTVVNEKQAILLSDFERYRHLFEGEIESPFSSKGVF